MAVKLGNDKKLFIQSATPGSYNELKGQGSLTRSQKAASIDISDKNSAPFSLTAPGNFDISIDQAGVVDLPDVNGIERAYTQWKARTTELFEIRKAPYGNGDAIWRASCYITGFDLDEPKDGASPYKISLGLAAAPTLDTLG